MTTTDTGDGVFECIWCSVVAFDRAAFPCCSTKCRDAAAQYRERSLRLWRPTTP